jgi:8-oxo-dGTP diphosphatase
VYGYGKKKKLDFLDHKNSSYKITILDVDEGRSECFVMSKSEYPQNPQSAVGAIVMRGGKVLLVRRNKPPGMGLWAIPGGRVTLGETLREAARREVKEETGVTVKVKDPVYAFDLIERDDQGRIRFHYVIVDLLADYVGGELNPDSDASEARWISSQELKELSVSQATRELLKDMFQFGC